MRKRKSLLEFPLRTTRYGDWCCVCLKKIKIGDRYLDGGALRRAHLHCARAVEDGTATIKSRQEQKDSCEAYHAEQARIVCAKRPFGVVPCVVESFLSEDD